MTYTGRQLTFAFMLLLLLKYVYQRLAIIMPRMTRAMSTRTHVTAAFDDGFTGGCGWEVR